MKYFAYGSNMNHKQMNDRCPGSKFLRSAYLNGYRLVCDGYSRSRKGPVCNIVYSEGDIVWGGLFEISKENEANLDINEGYPKTYNKSSINVEDSLGNKYKVIVYLRDAKEVGSPSEEYYEIVKEGAIDCALPKLYIERYIQPLIYRNIK